MDKMYKYNGYIYLKNIVMKKAMKLISELEGAIIIEKTEDRGREIAFDVVWVTVERINEEKQTTEWKNEFIKKQEEKIKEKLKEDEEIEFENYNLEKIL